MNLYYGLLYWKTLFILRHQRYRNLIETVFQEKCRSFVEIGTYNGLHGYQMLQAGKIFHPASTLEYYGFDLFEKQTQEDHDRELSKKPPPYFQVEQFLKKTDAHIQLFQGYTRETLPKFAQWAQDEKKQIDLIFIDGGHSIETIQSDWFYSEKIMSQNTVVIFDDFYNNTEKEVEQVGCQSLIQSLNKDLYHVEILHPENQAVKDWGILRVNMVKVKKKQLKV